MRKIDGLCAVFIDIDGTLIGKSYDTYKENIRVINKARALGHKFFICTGRGTAYLTKELEIDKNFDGVISGAGAISRFEGKDIFKHLMPFNLSKIFCDFVLENNLAGILEGEENMYYFEPLEKVYNIREENFVKLDKDNLYKILTPKTPIEKFTIIGEIPKELDELLGEDCRVLRHENYGEILQKKCDKGSALLETIKVLGVPCERSIAIGDSMNDYDMMMASGISVAMGNAIKEIKEIADIITDDVDKSGVATALAKIFPLA